MSIGMNMNKIDLSNLNNNNQCSNSIDVNKPFNPLKLNQINQINHAEEDFSITNLNIDSLLSESKRHIKINKSNTNTSKFLKNKHDINEQEYNNNNNNNINYDEISKEFSNNIKNLFEKRSKNENNKYNCDFSETSSRSIDEESEEDLKIRPKNNDKNIQTERTTDSGMQTIQSLQSMHNLQTIHNIQNEDIDPFQQLYKLFNNKRIIQRDRKDINDLGEDNNINLPNKMMSGKYINLLIIH